MEITYSPHINEAIEESESISRHQIPLHTNQNSNSSPVSLTVNSVSQDYMFQSIIHKVKTDDNCSFRNVPQQNSGNKMTANFPQITKPISASGNFQYNLEKIKSWRDKIEIRSYCPWLLNRLEVFADVDHENISMNCLTSQLRLTILNVAFDLMVYYHTCSKFSLQLFQVDAMNLLLILKHPKLGSILDDMPDGFSSNLEIMIGSLQNPGNSTSLDGSPGFSSFPITAVTENLINNLTFLNFKKKFLKSSQSEMPTVIYYSFFLPSKTITKEKIVHNCLYRKILSIERKFNCKINLDGPILRNYITSFKEEYYRIEIFFDYSSNQWFLVINEFIKWIDKVSQSFVECHVDQVCVGFVTMNLFCCDEIKNLMKRQYLFKEMDLDFVKLIKWANLHQMDRSTL